MNFDRKMFMKNFIKDIARISDEEYQKRVWIEGKGPECDDFDETCCRFFELGDPILNSYKDFGINEQQRELLIEFRNEFEKFSDENYSPIEFISSSEWKKIMDMAKEVLKAFHYNERSKIASE